MKPGLFSSFRADLNSGEQVQDPARRLVTGVGDHATEAVVAIADLVITDGYG